MYSTRILTVVRVGTKRKRGSRQLAQAFSFSLPKIVDAVEDYFFL